MAETERPACPKCGAFSGDDWSQCKGICPMPGSPFAKAVESASNMAGKRKITDAVAKDAGRQLDEYYPWGYTSEDDEP